MDVAVPAVVGAVTDVTRGVAKAVVVVDTARSFAVLGVVVAAAPAVAMVLAVVNSVACVFATVIVIVALAAVSDTVVVAGVVAPHKPHFLGHCFAKRANFCSLLAQSVGVTSAQAAAACARQPAVAGRDDFVFGTVCLLLRGV